MENKLIVLNNKSNFLKDEFIEYLNELKTINYSNMVLCPSTCYLSLVDNITLGSQYVSSNKSGDYTGSTNAEQLKSLNVKYTIVGHLERLIYGHETIVDIKNKLNNLIEQGIVPILCVGEELSDYQNDNSINVVLEKLNNILDDIDYSKIIISYEPYFAIGKDSIPDINIINNVVNAIKEKYNTKVLYGGSVNLNSIELLKNSDIIDGYLLGKVSLNIEELKRLIEVLNS